MSAANGGEKNNFKIDEDEGDEVKDWYERGGDTVLGDGRLA